MCVCVLSIYPDVATASQFCLHRVHHSSVLMASFYSGHIGVDGFSEGVRKAAKKLNVSDEALRPAQPVGVSRCHQAQSQHVTIHSFIPSFLSGNLEIGMASGVFRQSIEVI